MAGGIVTNENTKALRGRPGFNVHLLNSSQRMHLTKFTKEGVVNMENRKPYRSPALKKEARNNARKDSDGTYRSATRTLYHKTGSR